MSHEAAPDQAMVTEGEWPARPRREEPDWADAQMYARAVNTACLEPWLAERATSLGGDLSLADDQGMRWASLLAAFIDGMHNTPTPLPEGDVQGAFGK
ncbi:hypothetical protein OG978_26355 [Streptomyces sp. NBC_01591]|uniref:hypothetical protein n=1 Tax=Streptomyces sp. NBC_01591 TaxID=2975888 RepID=UPI002DDB9D3C|nr:hypothetical protein [Streptomyces sp. NBC_01591]WSD70591.1 hypothetical protein OG978_26355 [Streptomyces sp. NBC_01591]